MKTYNVIWFDDEYQTLELMVERAIEHGIMLRGFSNAEEGIAHLIENLSHYDAVIIDGVFLQDDKAGAATTDRALFSVALQLERLKDKKALPWFILSGQASFTKEKNPTASSFDKRVYDKLNEHDLSELWSHLKLAADQQRETQLRHLYQPVFNACNSFFGNYPADVILDLLKQGDELKADGNLNRLRKIIEMLFTTLHHHGFLPDAFAKPRLALNETSKLLAGKVEKGYELLPEAKPPKAIADMVRFCLDITQPASHASEKPTIEMSQGGHYLTKSVTFAVMELLVWFHQYIDQTPKGQWKEVGNHGGPPTAFIEGEVINLNQKGFAFFKPNNGSTNIFIPPLLVSMYGLRERQPISIEWQEYIDKTSGETKTAATKITTL